MTSRTRTLARIPLRWVLTSLFLVSAVTAGVLTWIERTDDTWLQIWIGVALSALTAGLVDMVGLIEAGRRRREADRRTAPVRRVVQRRLGEQRRALLSSVSMAFELSGEPSTWLAILQHSDPAIDVDRTVVALLPPRTVRVRASELRHQLVEQQNDLEVLSALTGFLTEQTEQMSQLCLRGEWLSLLEAMGTGWPIRSGVSAAAARMLEELDRVAIPT